MEQSAEIHRSRLSAALAGRIEEVEQRIRAACTRAGRDHNEVTLIAVTKTVAPEIAALLPDLGIGNLGESRPQELWRKAALLPASVHWHLIGHLQRNKIERTLPLVELVHSVDSLRLLDAIEHLAAAQNRTVGLLLEVNVSGEAAKHGFAPEEVAPLAPKINSLQNAKPLGLMTMAALEEDPERARPTFIALRKLRDRLREAVGSPHAFAHLSMGMTNDFEVAVEEGATFVRIGTALFEGLAENVS